MKTVWLFKYKKQKRAEKKTFPEKNGMYGAPVVVEGLSCGLFLLLLLFLHVSSPSIILNSTPPNELYSGHDVLPESS